MYTCIKLRKVENRFEMHIVEYKQFRDALRERYKSEVKQAEEEFDSQFKSYESQHGDYVKHADGVLKDLMANIEAKKKAMIDWEKRAEQRRQNAMEAAKRNKEGLENFQKQLSERQQLNMQGQNTNFGPLGKPVRRPALICPEYIRYSGTDQLTGSDQHDHIINYLLVSWQHALNLRQNHSSLLIRKTSTLFQISNHQKD